MKRQLLQFALLLMLVSVVAAATCFVTGRLVANGNADAHERIHKELGLTAKQESQLRPIEARFEARKAECLKIIQHANADLAVAIREDQANSPRTAEAVEKIHTAQAELQRATLDHVFEMRAVLRTDQYQKLLKLTAQALLESEHGD